MHSASRGLSIRGECRACTGSYLSICECRMWSNLEILDVADNGKGFPARNARTEAPVAVDGTTPVQVPVFSLLSGNSPRLAGGNPEHVQLLAAAHSLPPILVHRNTMRGIDGMHRLPAAKLRGDKTISVRVFDREDGEAVLLGVEPHLKH